MTKMLKIQRLLVANRSEIAVRVIHACRELGITSIAIYSEIDRTLPHVCLADEAYPIGAPPPRESYLNIDRIIKLAKQVRVDAIHPGYGFLSENASFAQAVEDAGMIFVGPSAEAIKLMGDKSEARALAKRSGVPILEGIELAGGLSEINDLSVPLSEYPLLVKAVAGGGGKGMRLVREPSDLTSAIRAAQSEAMTAFGDSRVFIEKYLEDARHIEIQVLADQYGNVVHLGERECSIQRRHQKVVEEAPSVVLTPELRTQIGSAAVALAHACGYHNAGTVEFLYDGKGRFYFLEMNTRVQVEHPVTEMVTGIDIVQTQIRIAQGERLPFVQEEIRMDKHAVECRVYAEDPSNNFFPSLGRVRYLRPPNDPKTRVEIGIGEGNEISVYYDPMIAKVICVGDSRSEALNRMDRALSDFKVSGIQTNISLLRWIINHENFRQGLFSTRFLEGFDSGRELAPSALTKKVAAISAALLHENNQTKSGTVLPSDGTFRKSAWKQRLFDRD